MAEPAAAPTRYRYRVLSVFLSLAFLNYLDRICMARADEDVKRRISDGGSIAVASATPDEAKTFVLGEAERWSAVAKAVNATAD